MRHRAADLVAIILALGLVTTSSLIGLALVVNVARGHNPSPTLGENTTQVLIAVLGGLVGILGSYLGFSAFVARAQRPNPDEAQTEEWKWPKGKGGEG
jgi:hypothetical protein